MFESVGSDILDSSRTRKIVSFLLASPIIVILLARYLPFGAEFYEHHRVGLDLMGAVLTTALTFIEVMHSGEANRYRKRAIEYRERAHTLNEQKFGLEQNRLDLQVRINVLQEEIEKKLTKIRLYARVHKESPGIGLHISNLSSFVLWLNQVLLIITHINGVAVQPAKEHILGGARGLAKGESRTGFLLYGTLMRENNNQASGLDVSFEVKVTVTGVDDAAETKYSPTYRYAHGDLVTISHR
jgi:hypothetical protein